MFYGSPNNLISPGLARTMGDGWETARRRDDGNDWVTLRLAAPGTVRLAELDTSYFMGNAPGWASLRGCHAPPATRSADDWFELLPRTRLQPDTRHRLPDRRRPGPRARCGWTSPRRRHGPAARCWGALTGAGRDGIEKRWRASAPRDQQGGRA